MIGAVEAQKAEVVLHLHLFIFVQMAHQFENLQTIANKIRQHLLSVEAFKAFVDHARCASYPGLQHDGREREDVESEWPAHRGEYSLCRPPAFVWKAGAAKLSAEEMALLAQLLFKQL